MIKDFNGNLISVGVDDYLDLQEKVTLLREALIGMLGESSADMGNDLECYECGEDYSENPPKDRLCVDPECPRFIARAALERTRPQ